MYRVGITNDPQATDATYDSDAEARQAAAELSRSIRDSVVVWRGDEPVYVFLMGEQFRRV